MSRSGILLEMLARFLLGFGSVMLVALGGASMGNKAASAQLGYSVPLEITWKTMAQPFVGGMAVGLMLAFWLYRKTYKAGDVKWCKPYIIGIFMTTIWIAGLFLAAATKG
jgi:hypothetical protein